MRLNRVDLELINYYLIYADSLYTFFMYAIDTDTYLFLIVLVFTPFHLFKILNFAFETQRKYFNTYKTLNHK